MTVPLQFTIILFSTSLSSITIPLSLFCLAKFTIFLFSTSLSFITILASPLFSLTIHYHSVFYFISFITIPLSPFSLATIHYLSVFYFILMHHYSCFITAQSYYTPLSFYCGPLLVCTLVYAFPVSCAHLLCFHQPYNTQNIKLHAYLAKETK